MKPLVFVTETPLRWLRAARLLALMCMAGLVAGCAGVRVDSISTADYLKQRRGDVLSTGELSLAAQEVLRVVGLDAALCKGGAPACRSTLGESGGITDEQRLATLAELWLQSAQAAARAPMTEAPPQQEQIDQWLEAARHAYAYLFFTRRAPSERAFEDRQAQVRDYYNYAVQEALTRMFRLRRTPDGRPPPAPPADQTTTTVGPWTLDFSSVREAGDEPDRFEELIPAASMRFSGLRNVYRRDGFGAELVTALAPEDAPSTHAPPGLWAGPSNAEATEPPYRTMPFPPMTALLMFEGADLPQVLATRRIRIVLRDPYRTASEHIAGYDVPLAANFSAGYGLWLARSGFATQALDTLLGRNGGIDRPRIHLLQPYDPDRRIVVMLHGLASSPEAWINVANEVLGDEALRRNYQIWQVYYPTNAPLAVNRHTIRVALDETLRHFDPAGTARASRDITLLGHSMGGVLARLMVSSAGDRLTQAMKARYDLAARETPPGADAGAHLADKTGFDADDDDDLREVLDQYLRFEPMPQVSDAIFVASPHRGTPFANQRLARWAANLVTLPVSMLRQLSTTTRVLGRLRPRDVSNESGARPMAQIPNSIDNLSERDDFIRQTAEMPIDPGVRLHSIIGNDTPGTPLAESSDGVVPYTSAHLPQAQSELVLHSSHSVQEHPQAILEIRRILTEELRVEGDGNGAAR